ncbi:MAG: hypothetical protein ACM3TN_08900 [Alphaproteobacteria bacterium]
MLYIPAGSAHGFCVLRARRVWRTSYTNTKTFFSAPFASPR